MKLRSVIIYFFKQHKFSVSLFLVGLLIIFLNILWENLFLPEILKIKPEFRISYTEYLLNEKLNQSLNFNFLNSFKEIWNWLFDALILIVNFSLFFFIKKYAVNEFKIIKRRHILIFSFFNIAYILFLKKFNFNIYIYYGFLELIIGLFVWTSFINFRIKWL